MHAARGKAKVGLCCCRSQLLEFYASSGDFTRRLTSVKANGKFSSPSAGAQDYWTVSPLCPPPMLLLLLHMLLAPKTLDDNNNKSFTGVAADAKYLLGVF